MHHIVQHTRLSTYVAVNESGSDCKLFDRALKIYCRYVPGYF